MAKPIWQQKLQAKLDNNPLYRVEDKDKIFVIKYSKCKGEEKGKKLSLREVVNYNLCKCEVCGIEYR
jgi:hypothetical protein